MHPKDKVSLYLRMNIVYIWSCPQESCNQSCISESSRWLENRAKECNSHVTSAIFIYSESNNHPFANISHFKIIDKDNKQVGREDRKVIHSFINNLGLNCNTGKMYIPEIFNSLPDADMPSCRSVKLADLDLP